MREWYRREGNAQAQRDSQIASRNRRIEAARAYDRARGHRGYGAEKDRARNATMKAIIAGRLVRQPCEVCGAAKVDAHHDDYSKPLDVRWLCRLHHMAIHRKVA
jgi:hypothetical protein